jgi:hypothetical protein
VPGEIKAVLPSRADVLAQDPAARYDFDVRQV